MRRVFFGLASLLVTQAFACNVDSPPAPAEKHVQETQPIIGGTLDNTNSATVYLDGTQGNQGYACSGTIIAVNGSVGYVLTAGHCVAGTVNHVRIGANATTASVYPVIQQWQHPNYNTQTLRYDFGMVAFDGADANTPIVPAAQAPDGISANGTSLELSGYGLTQAGVNGGMPSGPTTHRMHVTELTNQLSFLGNQAPDTTIQIGFDQSNGTGTCEGDSGGPAYFGSGASRRVVGVTSYGDPSCAEYGVSGRVAAVYDTFIAPILNGQPPMQTCDTCTQSAVSPGGACSSQVDACLANTECSALNDCLQTCNGNQTCINNCATQHSGGVALFNAIFDCAYCSACTSYCDQSQCAMSTSVTTGTGTPTASSTGAGNTSNTSAATGGTGTGGGGGAGGTGSSGSGNNNPSGGTTTTVTKCACEVAGTNDDGALAGLGVMGALGLALSTRRRRAR